MARGSKKPSRRVWVPEKNPVPKLVPVPKRTVADRAVWTRDPRDPPESYFDGRSPTGLIRPEKWECKYGCPGVQVLLGTNVPHHAWNCPYWYNEGKNETPF